MGTLKEPESRDFAMAFWSGETLELRIPADDLIVPYNPDRIKCSAYEMGVGGEAFVTSKPTDGPRLSAGKQIEIPPGQFGLLITEEVVTIPSDAIGFISIRAGIKFLGLVNVSGFHVDPGFKGQLKFAVYNAGSQTIRLDQGQPIFMIWFCDLDDPTEKLYDNRTPAQNVITADDVAKLHGEVASPAELKKQIDELKRELEKKTRELQAEIDKKFHTVEQSRLFNRGLVMLAIGAILSLTLTVIGWMFIKPIFDRPSEKKAENALQDENRVAPKPGVIDAKPREKVDAPSPEAKAPKASETTLKN
jgi:dCTP deaminase